MRDQLTWPLKSDSGLFVRVAAGVSIFLVLAIVDLRRRGRAATRWREYIFLLAASLGAMFYGLLNDFLASSISWEYFYYGKGLESQLGLHVPPNADALAIAACKIGLKASWSVGLFAGVALLIANNPRPSRKRLPYRSLFLLLIFIFLTTAIFAAIGAGLGSHRHLNWTSADLAGIWRDNLFRPQRFCTVYGMNLGSYAGAIVGTASSVIYVIRTRSCL